METPCLNLVLFNFLLKVPNEIYKYVPVLVLHKYIMIICKNFIVFFFLKVKETREDLDVVGDLTLRKHLKNGK